MGKENDVLSVLKSALHARNVPSGQLRLPSKVRFTRKDEKTVEMELDQEAIGGLCTKPRNMQDDNAAFEAWAIILHVYLGCDILLKVDSCPEIHFPSGHYHRFLYRVFKFSDQFKGWFHCDEKLQNCMNEYKAYLYESNHCFTNNIPNNEARNNNHLENIVEAAMAGEGSQNILISLAEQKGLKLSEGQIYRQLPVGLFHGPVSKETSEFTGGKSAIDLWAPAGDRIAIFELKANNKMAGIITELMFYANYVYDMFLDKAETGCISFQPNKAETEYRGYRHLLKSYTNVKAYFLTDKLHPLITQEVIDLMNENAHGIIYDSLHYDLTLTVNGQGVVGLQ